MECPGALPDSLSSETKVQFLEHPVLGETIQLLNMPKHVNLHPTESSSPTSQPGLSSGMSWGRYPDGIKSLYLYFFQWVKK